jgi:limonene-1,2-epoxide hydrolase
MARGLLRRVTHAELGHQGEAGEEFGEPEPGCGGAAHAPCNSTRDLRMAGHGSWSGSRQPVDFDQTRAHIRRVTRPSDVAESFVAAISQHDLDAVEACFAEDYEDEAPARPGEVVRGRDEVRANFARMFTSMPDVNATIIRLAERENEVWIEWRMSGTRDDGTSMDFVGVNIFGVADGAFRWGRIYTELTRSAGGIEAQLARMTGDNAPT